MYIIKIIIFINDIMCLNENIDNTNNIIAIFTITKKPRLSDWNRKRY